MTRSPRGASRDAARNRAGLWRLRFRGYASPEMAILAEPQPPAGTAPVERRAPSPGLVGAIRTRLSKLAEDVRRADRFLKMRAAILGAWAVLAAATLWGACPSSGPANALGADVQVSRDSIMGVQLLVRNESTRIWEDVVLTLDDGWRYTHPTMRPHDLVVLSMSHFTKGEKAPPRDYKPRALVVECGQGSHTFDLR
jgi:hypothetical protein